MKARDRVDRLSTRCLGANVIEGREVEDDGTKRAPKSRVQVPVLRLKWRQRGRIKVRESGRLRIGSDSFANPGAGDKVTKFLKDGTSREMSCATCLMRKLPNDTPFRPSWQLLIE